MDAYTREFTLETADAAELFRCLQDTAAAAAWTHCLPKGMLGCCCGSGWICAALPQPEIR